MLATDIQRRLEEVDHRLADLHQEQVELEGRRDSLLLQLIDSDGAEDRRYVAVR